MVGCNECYIVGTICDGCKLKYGELASVESYNDLYYPEETKEERIQKLVDKTIN